MGTEEAMDERRAPTILDVATHAGVSRQTVSRVINDHPEVNAATRARVLASIRVLDYRPDVAAQALGRRRGGAPR
jgi:DNA-binding LacI/PurR family transcriptional regulator